MVAAELIIGFLIAPRNAERGNHGPRVCFVFVREQKIDAALEQLGIIRSGGEYKPFGRTLPLPDESLARLFEGNTQRLRQRAERVVSGSSKCQSEGEFRPLGKIEPTG